MIKWLPGLLIVAALPVSVLSRVQGCTSDDDDTPGDDDTTAGDDDTGDDDATHGGSSSGWLYTSSNHIYTADGQVWHGRGANLPDTRSCGACAWEEPDPDEVNRRADTARRTCSR